MGNSATYNEAKEICESVGFKFEFGFVKKINKKTGRRGNNVVRYFVTDRLGRHELTPGQFTKLYCKR